MNAIPFLLPHCGASWALCPGFRDKAVHLSHWLRTAGVTSLCLTSFVVTRTSLTQNSSSAAFARYGIIRRTVPRGDKLVIISSARLHLKWMMFRKWVFNLLNSVCASVDRLDKSYHGPTFNKIPVLNGEHRSDITIQCPFLAERTPSTGIVERVGR